MDIRQLRYFSAIAEEGQITRAAKKLHIAQPPLSAQLKSLEQELGVLLVERNGRTLVLTEAGKVLYEKAKNILQQVDETILEIKEIDDGLKGTLTIGAVKSAFFHIPERMRMFREKFPDVKFHLKEGDSYRLAEDVINREIELAIVRLPLDLNTFNCILLPTDHFVLVVPEAWDLPSPIKMKNISEIPLMLLHRVSGTGLYELVLEECTKYNVEPHIICECSDAAMLLSLVKARVGASLLPKSTIQSLPLNGLKVIDIEDNKLKTESAVIWLKDRYLTKSATRFLETFYRED